MSSQVLIDFCESTDARGMQPTMRTFREKQVKKDATKSSTLFSQLEQIRKAYKNDPKRYDLRIRDLQKLLETQTDEGVRRGIQKAIMVLENKKKEPVHHVFDKQPSPRRAEPWQAMPITKQSVMAPKQSILQDTKLDDLGAQPRQSVPTTQKQTTSQDIKLDDLLRTIESRPQTNSSYVTPARPPSSPRR